MSIVHLKKPTRKQKILMSEKGYNPEEYQVVSDTQYSLIIQHRISGKQQMIERTYPQHRWMR